MPYKCSEISPAQTLPSPASSPHILLCGDDARIVLPLHRALLYHGFRVQTAAYRELEAIWKQGRHPIILLEVTGQQSIERAIAAALQIKSIDNQQFVGYLADDFLRSYGGLAGDAIFPRTINELVIELRRHLHIEA
jgi:hypothetical protein